MLESEIPTFGIGSVDISGGESRRLWDSSRWWFMYCISQSEADRNRRRPPRSAVLTDTYSPPLEPTTNRYLGTLRIGFRFEGVQTVTETR